MRPAVQLVIEGRVQGVGFRWWTVEQATRLGLSGWVRNRRDGAVEVLAIGRAGDIDRLKEACRQGPLGSRVETIALHSAEDDGSQGFHQRATV
jgi:acylphosphatase